MLLLRLMTVFLLKMWTPRITTSLEPQTLRHPISWVHHPPCPSLTLSLHLSPLLLQHPHPALALLILPQLPWLRNPHPFQALQHPYWPPSLAFLPLFQLLTPLVLTTFGSLTCSLHMVATNGCTTVTSLTFLTKRRQDSCTLSLRAAALAFSHHGQSLSLSGHMQSNKQHRAHTSPYVTGVSFTTCSKVNFLDEGIMHMMEAIDLKEAHWLT